jgi:2-isopropylmalate synthase
VTAGADAVAACYIKARVDGCEVWGVGMDTSVVTAMVRAAVSAVDQALVRTGEEGPDLAR